eukprot:TRINITY_DN23866_c0_g1_i1.p2 TRINITY_DN23866_c0_g1~~TRINITY_DN23866_c0_g1_i1.p2  ORF type:complete len:162 (-),score=48.39 TRINITY_DN23866_c0_g1_i1:58-543(-)
MPRQRRAADSCGPLLDRQLEDLFALHDINGNGALEEKELVLLNLKIAELHKGKDADRTAVKQKYRTFFRSKLSPNGRPVAFDLFRTAMLQLLADLDPFEDAQEMIMEQFITEAQVARASLAESGPSMSFDSLSSGLSGEVLPIPGQMLTVGTPESAKVDER